MPAVILFFFSLLIIGSFEGEVVYLNTFVLHDQRASIDSLRAIHGDTIILLLKGGNYKLITTGRNRTTSSYEGEKNIWYVYNSKRDTIVAVSGLRYTMESMLFEIPQNTNEKVLGYECKAVAMTSKSERDIYYYNEGFPIDANLFKGHNIDGWNQYCDISKSVPLMIRYEKKGYTIVQTAIQINEREIDAHELALPSGKPILRLGKF